jgi:hypothetical protein
LTGEDIRSLFSGSTIAGSNVDGTEWFMDFDQGGRRFVFRGVPWTLGECDPWGWEDAGTVRCDRETLCFQHEKFYSGMEHFCVAYKNPDGAPELKNEYLFIGDLGMMPCSPVR